MCVRVLGTKYLHIETHLPMEGEAEDNFPLSVQFFFLLLGWILLLLPAS
jgi:hypothetical protein